MNNKLPICEWRNNENIGKSSGFPVSTACKALNPNSIGDAMIFSNPSGLDIDGTHQYEKTKYV